MYIYYLLFIYRYELYFNPQKQFPIKQIRPDLNDTRIDFDLNTLRINK